MQEELVEVLEPRKFGLFSIIDHLSPDTVEQLGLLVPQAEFDILDSHECFAYQNQIAWQLDTVIAPIWNDHNIQFLVVCGDTVFASGMDLIDFDREGFAASVPYLPTFIIRGGPK